MIEASINFLFVFLISLVTVIAQFLNTKLILSPEKKRGNLQKYTVRLTLFMTVPFHFSLTLISTVHTIMFLAIYLIICLIIGRP